jgi:hypothetical protein
MLLPRFVVNPKGCGREFPMLFKAVFILFVVVIVCALIAGFISKR